MAETTAEMVYRHQQEEILKMQVEEGLTWDKHEDDGPRPIIPEARRAEGSQHSDRRV